MLVLGIFFSQTIHAWWSTLLSLTPYIGMLGIVVDTKVGAFIYNLLHCKGIATAIYLVGVFYSIEILLFVGCSLFS